MYSSVINSVVIATVLIVYASSIVADGLVIRGGQCSAKAFADASGVDVIDGYLTGLSVNCTNKTHDKADYDNYLTSIDGYSQYCVARIDQLNLKHITVTPDKKTDNKYHCLVSGKLKDIVKILTRYD